MTADPRPFMALCGGVIVASWFFGGPRLAVTIMLIVLALAAVIFREE
jgi:hypothetical protein